MRDWQEDKELINKCQDIKINIAIGEHFRSIADYWLKAYKGSQDMVKYVEQRYEEYVVKANALISKLDNKLERAEALAKAAEGYIEDRDAYALTDLYDAIKAYREVTPNASS